MTKTSNKGWTDQCHQVAREPNWREVLRGALSRRNLLLLVLLAAGVGLSLSAVFYNRFPGDLSLTLGVQAWRHPVTTAIMEGVSFIGKGWPMVALAIVATACFFVARRRRECLVVVAALVVMGLSPLLKLLVDRPRPPSDLVTTLHSFGGLGYPSGHAFQAIVLFGLLAFLASTLIGDRGLRHLVQALLAVLILAIGVSRVYLGAHWPSDVLGGYLLGGFFLLLLLRGYQAVHSTRSLSQERFA